MDKDIRIILIKEDGTITTLFSSLDTEIDNTIEIKKDESIEKLTEYYEQIKDLTYKKDDFMDKHLYYLKKYISDNMMEEFNNIRFNPLTCDDDLLLYFLLTEFGNVVFVNSAEHINIAAIPSVGMTDEQKSSIEKLESVMNKKTNWEIADNMHFEVQELGGKKYKSLNVGETRTGKFTDIKELGSENKNESEYNNRNI